jgi:hypothetical protein
MDTQSEQVKLLLAEKAHIEQRITANIELQQKVIALGFTAVITTLGWLFSAKPDLQLNSLVIILLSIVSISALSVLMAVIYGGFALSAILFKEEVLGVALQEILAMQKVFSSLKATQLGPASRPINIATAFLCLAHVGLSVTVYVGAVATQIVGSTNGFGGPFVVGAVIAGTLLTGSVLSLWSLNSAIRIAQRG